ncbi:MAG: alpha/beta hydrolase, partial [bacterium]|nr:alpha/beta hydrolase [bacterium]
MSAKAVSEQPKPILVFVPGLAADGSVYEPFLRTFRADFDVRSADHPLTLPEGGLPWDFFFEPIDRALDGTRGYLVGHSMGGAIALKYAARYPGRVRKTVAVAPILFPFRRDRHRVRESLRNML